MPVCELLFLKEICNGKFLVKTLFHVKQHQFQIHSVLLIVLTSALHVEEWEQLLKQCAVW